MTLRQEHVAVVAGLLFAWSTAAVAQTTDPRRCATIGDVAARVACYDAIFGVPAQPAAVVAPAAPVSSAAPPASAEFGLTPAQTQKPQPPPDASSDPKSVTATLAVLKQRRTGEYVYELDNGQRWLQSEVDVEGKLEPGAPVTIKKAALGSYKLVSGTVATRVRRIE